jgi:Xaa-Pro dipeptidase
MPKTPPTECRIPSTEYRDRLDRLRRTIRGAGLDLFIVSSFESIYYLTGTGFEPLERPFFLLVRPEADRPPVLLVPKLDEEHLRRTARTVEPENVHAYWEVPAPAGRRWQDALRELIGPTRAVGVEPSLRLDIAEQLRDYSPRVEPLVERLRLVKSPAEIEMIRRAAYYADFGVKRLMAVAYSGASVAEGLADTRTVAGRILRNVPDWEPLTTRVLMATWAGRRSARPHTIPELTDRLGAGPNVALVLTRVNGYSAESERTFFTARPTAEMGRAFGAMTRAREIAFSMVCPGVACAEIDGAVNAFLLAEYPDYQIDDHRLHRTGHGIGLGTHEGPCLAVGSGEVLAENEVISIEPGIYLPGVGGFRRSDTVRVTDRGHERLTCLPDDLASMMVLGWKPLTRLRGWYVRRKVRLDEKVNRWDRFAAGEAGPAG